MVRQAIHVPNRLSVWRLSHYSSVSCPKPLSHGEGPGATPAGRNMKHLKHRVLIAQTYSLIVPILGFYMIRMIESLRSR